MSGFAGIFCRDGATPHLAILDQMASRIAFRGPDARQISARPGAGVAFALLRTGPAPQAEKQPVVLEDRWWFAGDVRLDGRADLGRTLQDAAALESGATDEVLALLAWKQWGPDALARLFGEYSFAIWDREEQRGWLARDLIGTRPLFYAISGTEVYFSNTLDALLSAPGLSLDLDEHFLGDFLLQGWCPDAERTVYKNIRRVPPGHVCEVSTGSSRISRRALLAIDEPLWLKRPEEYVERYRAAIDEAVHDRLPRGPTAVFMSGGLDSTMVASVAAEFAGDTGQRDRLRAYTVDYNPLFEDGEAANALLVAKHAGIGIEFLQGADSLPFAGWDSAALRMPEPCHEPFLELHVEHYRKVARHSRVSLTGDGGDSILTGQSWPYFVYLAKHGWLRQMALSFGGYLLRHRRFPPLRGGFRRRWKKWTGQDDVMQDYPKWLAPDFERRLNLRQRWGELQEPPKYVHPIHPTPYSTLTGTYWAGVLEWEDAAWSGVPVETRLPLLDRRVLEFLLRVPPVPLCMDKELLRRAVRGLLPEEVRLRPKTPLQGDPFLLHAESRRWRPGLPTKLAEPLGSLVRPAAVVETLANSSGFSIWQDSLPISLHYWLQSIEKKDGIQYAKHRRTE